MFRLLSIATIKLFDVEVFYISSNIYKYYGCCLCGARNLQIRNNTFYCS